MRVEDLGLRVKGFRFTSPWCGVKGLRYRFWDSGYRIKDQVFRNLGAQGWKKIGFRVQVSGIRAKDSELEA